MKLSVIIPCYNAAHIIGAQLEALAGQRWAEPWEVIVADNGSTDNSVAVAMRFAERLPQLRVIHASERKGAAHARNAGARVATGDCLAFCDADDEVASGWLSAIGEALREHDFVASRFDTEKLNPGWLSATQNSPQKDGVQRVWYPPYLSHAGACGLGVKRNFHELVGGFDESLPLLEDTDYCFRIQLAGAKLHFAPAAVISIRYRNEFGRMFTQARLWAQYNVLMYKKYRPPGVLMPHPWRRYMRGVKYLLWSLLEAHTKAGRAAWLWRLGWQIGRLQGSVKHRVHPV